MVQVVDGETGEVLSQEQIEFAYSREGRRDVGKEYPNPIPMEAPIGFTPSKPVHEMIRDMVLREMSQVAQANDMETAEEADDFDVDDDYDPSSPWEFEYDPQAVWPPRPEVAAAENAVVTPGAAAAAVPPAAGAASPSAEPPPPSTPS